MEGGKGEMETGCPRLYWRVGSPLEPVGLALFVRSVLVALVEPHNKIRKEEEETYVTEDDKHKIDSENFRR